MALNFGQNLFQGASYLEGEDGTRAVVDIDGNLNVSGAVSFPAAQAVFFEKAEQVWFSGAQYVAFETAQSVTFPTAQSVTFDDVENVYAVQSGAYIISGPVTQSGAWTVTGTTNVDIQNSVIDMNISGATIENNTLLSDWKYAVDNATSITSGAGANNATATIYTVPSGKKFYLFSASINGYSDADILSNVQMFGDSKKIISVTVANTIRSMTNSISASQPVRYESGALITVVSGHANAFVVGEITGIEADI